MTSKGLAAMTCSTLPRHLFTASDGALHDTRNPGWSAEPPLRQYYRGQFNAGAINSTEQFKTALRTKTFTDLNNYPLFFLMNDDKTLSFKTARANLRPILEALD